ncbi:hypothetical protein N7466_007765 [Penicillium verhagenii]|uniref:uncharacterized protein n=1 Tax=Penicillium verhagenii TaxID=1562060 RepID=UPI0025459A90|nr:uncharacterized protein N7466_007765 [Penicillium verhagenii]KAJ5928809.1 hypothetical protein N7466_007765 [Penicillium verhagenii]
MTQFSGEDSKAPPSCSISIKSSDLNKTEEHENEHVSSRAPCPTHGPSQSERFDRELERPQAQEIIRALKQALNDINDQEKCTKCAVENASTVLTTQVREIREAKRNGEWTKEERKALKAETKAIFKPVKKSIKALWKEGR